MRSSLATYLSIFFVLLACGVLGVLFFSKKEPIRSNEILLAPPAVEMSTSSILGHSVEGRDLTVYSYGKGKTHILFVGGIHGGYEWNSTLLAYTMMDYFKSNQVVIPDTITVDIIPSANPDALYKVTGKEGQFKGDEVTRDIKTLESARFNANSIDLNRNFDCKWKPTSTWRSKTVNAGQAPFSEPESRLLQSLIQEKKPVLVVFWHSKANGVYASQCEHGILPETITAMNIYAEAAHYPAIQIFDAYETTGAADDWLASITVPAITVELKTHEDIDWEKNKAGVTAILEHYKK
jgi:predicted deacylase